MYQSNTGISRKTTLLQIASLKRSFSAPLLWIYVVAPPPPNVAESPDALCCKRMQIIRTTHVIASMKSKSLTIWVEFNDEGAFGQ